MKIVEKSLGPSGQLPTQKMGPPVTGSHMAPTERGPREGRPDGYWLQPVDPTVPPPTRLNGGLPTPTDYRHYPVRRLRLVATNLTAGNDLRPLDLGAPKCESTFREDINSDSDREREITN